MSLDYLRSSDLVERFADFGFIPSMIFDFLPWMNDSCLKTVRPAFKAL